MLDITYESSAWQMIQMLCQALFSLKNRKQKKIVVCPRIFLGALRVNLIKKIELSQLLHHGQLISECGCNSVIYTLFIGEKKKEER